MYIHIEKEDKLSLTHLSQDIPLHEPWVVFWILSLKCWKPQLKRTSRLMSPRFFWNPFSHSYSWREKKTEGFLHVFSYSISASKLSTFRTKTQQRPWKWISTNERTNTRVKSKQVITLEHQVPLPHAPQKTRIVVSQPIHLFIHNGGDMISLVVSMRKD